MEADVEAEAQFNLIKMLMKPFLGPIFDLFVGIVEHEPYSNCVNSKADGKDCISNDFNPDVTVVTKHKKPRVFNHGHKFT